MLSVTKLRVGAEAYQLTGVAQSLDDYYSGAGEAEGWWAGSGAARLDLRGAVSGDDLRALLAGLRPGGGGLSPNGEQIRPHPRRVPGFDLTFKAPKSVSVLYAVTDDPRVQGAVIEGCEAALRQTLGWLEREAMAVRRGSGNQRFLADLAQVDPAEAEAARLRTKVGAEMAAAVFRHRTSRAGDPLLHWHVLLPNLVCGTDGRWSALVHPRLFQASRAAGEVFQATLRDELTARLGVEWRQGRHVGEVQGVPQSVCDAFSKRSHEIDAWIEAHGLTNDRGARQQAVLATRRGKAELEGERFDTRWKLEATALGFGPEQVEQLILGARSQGRAGANASESWRLPELCAGPDGTPYTHDRVVTRDEWIADLLRTDLLANDSTFSRTDLIRAVAHRLGDGASVGTIDAIASQVLASPHVTRIEAGDTDQWTSRELLGYERRLLDAYQMRNNREPVPEPDIAAVLHGRPDLGADQRRAVRAIAGSANQVSVLIGPAGTGKTHTLAVVREAFQAVGYDVIGAAPSARAAAELEAGAGIASRTLHSLARQWDRPGAGPTARTVLVIDESAMAGTFDLEPLVTRTVAGGGRVVLVGDHHQLPEVTVGGGLAAAVATAGSVAELTENRRQRQEWERHALAELRSGSVPAAVAAYRDHGRVLVIEDAEQLASVAADRYLTAIDSGLQPVLMAGTNEMVRRLNRTVRERLVERGELSPMIDEAGRTPRFAPADRVVLRRNHRAAQHDGTFVAVRNSDAATVESVGVDGSLTVRRHADGMPIVLDQNYVDRFVEHGYAITAHRAQGGTWDLAIAVGADGLYREAAYVQMSRGRIANEILIPSTQMDAIEAELARHDRGIPLPDEHDNDPVEDLLDRLQRSRAKLFALARDPDADNIARLAGTTSIAELERRAHQCQAAEREATRVVGVDPAALTAALERAQRTAHHVRVGVQVKAFDRSNIGTVVGIDDQAGTVDVHFVSQAGHEAIRTLPWTEVHIVDRDLPPPRILPERAQHNLDHLVESCRETLDARNRHLDAAGVEPSEARCCERARTLAIDRAAAQLAADQPAWLIDLLGPRPEHPHDVAVWDNAVRSVAEHRGRYALDKLDGIGPEPADQRQARDWRGLSKTLLATRNQLSTADAQRDLGDWPLLRSRSQLLERRDQLDALLATAPPDQRHLLDRLRDGNQLTLEDTTEALQTALETQGARRDWILANWPFVVEYAEITRAIDEGLYGPELDDLRASLRRHSQHPELLAALDRGDGWIDRALCRCVGRNASSVAPEVRALIERMADDPERSLDTLDGEPREQPFGGRCADPVPRELEAEGFDVFNHRETTPFTVVD